MHGETLMPLTWNVLTRQNSTDRKKVCGCVELRRKELRHVEIDSYWACGFELCTWGRVMDIFWDKAVMLGTHLVYSRPRPHPVSPTDLHVVVVMFTGPGIAASHGCIQSYSGVTPKCLYISSLTELEGGQRFSASHPVQGETANGCCHPAKFSAARKPPV